MRGFVKRYLLWRINHLTPFKHSKLKAKLFNKIEGCSIGENSIIVGPIYLNGCTLKIGNNVHVGHDLMCDGNGHIEIGDNCDIAPCVTFLTGTHEIGDETRRAGKGITANIKIGNGVWIGSKSVILANKNGMEIGDSSVIGCMSNVIRPVEPNTLVGGNPAKKIKEL